MRRYQHKFTFPAIIVTLVIAVAGLLYAVFQFQTNTTYPENSTAKVMGLLLDQTNGYVDFDKLSAADVDFVFIRSTQGKSYFDDRYLENRDRLSGSNIDFGTAQFFSDESTVQEQFIYFREKVGTRTGALPVLIVPATKSTTKNYWQKMGRFAELLINSGDQVIILGERQRIAQYFPQSSVFYMSTGDKLPKASENYDFWRYTETGRIKGMEQMDSLTMYTFIGSQTKYNQFLGRK